MLNDLEPFDVDGALRVVVESPCGADAKFALDLETGFIKYVRALPLGMRYPFDWGFIPGTLAEDGDPLDALVLSDTTNFPGVVVPARPIGVLEVEQDAKSGGRRIRNDRLLTVPAMPGRLDRIEVYEDIALRRREEIEAFLIAAVHFEGKNVAIIGRGTPSAGVALIESLRVSPRKPAAERRSTHVVR